MSDEPEWLATYEVRVDRTDPALPVLRSGFDSAALWIGRENPEVPSGFGSHAPAPLVRRTFAVDSTVSRAMLRITALGYYEAWINGSRVGDALIDPAPSQYDRVALSREYDVTALLLPGQNVLGAILGRSFASGITTPGGAWTTEPRLLAELDLTYADGDTSQIVTDGSWKLADSCIRDWMYYGEDYDARSAQLEWSQVGFDDSGWHSPSTSSLPLVSVVPALAPPVRQMRVFDVASMTELSPTSRLYDAGQITAGWAKLTVKGERGARVTLSYGQQLTPEGTVSLVTPTMHVDSYVLAGEAIEEWEPRFTRHGFQFVQVDVLAGSVDEIAIDIRENYSSAESTGTFACSNSIINTVHENHRQTLKLVHWGFPTDTAWRDRQGWTADTAMFMDSAILNFNDFALVYRDWLRSLRATQQSDGGLSIYAPDSFEYPLHNDPCWSGMMILIPWTVYQHTGDRGIVEENFDVMVAWLDRMIANIADTGDLYAGFSFGDHSSPDAGAGGSVDLSSPEGSDIARNAYLFHEARTLAQIARELESDPEIAVRFDAAADRILAAFTHAYLVNDEAVYRTPSQEGYRQTSNLLPLAFGMVPEELVADVFANLVGDLEWRGRRLNTGALGTKVLLPVLTAHGRADLAYALAAQTEYPSWGYWVTAGATTSWETWRIEGPEHSMDHPFLGTVDDWLFQHLAGIQAASPGYSRVRLAPQFPHELEHAAAEITTPHGKVSSAWRRAEGRIFLEISVPDDVPYDVVLPDNQEVTVRVSRAA